VTSRPRCYVASPLGFTEAGRHYYNAIYLPALAAVVEPVDPWSFTTPAELQAAERDGAWPELNARIGARNVEAIRSCTLLAAHLDGQEVDSGTAAEIGFGSAIGLRCFGLRGDWREAGEKGAAVNLQVESFILLSGGRVVGDLAQLVEALRQAAADLATPAFSGGQSRGSTRRQPGPR
jgi:nucleoside 2-deoxyribosyltransferase